eukprot:Blabericola_migrator_1__8398@NODE_4372_length_1193_cov_21_285080_g2704_i0_p1_GENE_NODE_4372_length_1193_cov_21_285080_g2704_i0NODE_4372_length_1193_cov_21_285080_g2704_i0_p1_ORF_typecomplete_len142_score31_32DUF4407/PF14362_6/9_2_NODE_4372_length_1193_cov_21_285080_g2704_i033458
MAPINQPPSHPQRGLPGPARHRKRDSHQRVKEIDEIISHKKHEQHRAKDPQSWNDDFVGQKRGKAERLAKDYVEEEDKHEGLEHELQERHAILEVEHQKQRDHKSKRDKEAAKRQRRLSQQTGIINKTNNPDFNRLVGSKF